MAMILMHDMGHLSWENTRYCRRIVNDLAGRPILPSQQSNTVQDTLYAFKLATGVRETAVRVSSAAARGGQTSHMNIRFVVFFSTIFSSHHGLAHLLFSAL